MTDGLESNRSSTTMRTDRPGVDVIVDAATSVNTPATCGRSASGAICTGPSPTKRAPEPAAEEKMCSSVHRADATSARGADATVSPRIVTVTVLASAVTFSADARWFFAAGGIVVRTVDEASVGAARSSVHGMVMSRSCAIWATSGEVMSALSAPSVCPCGQVTVAVVVVTGRNGVSTAATMAITPATTAAIAVVRGESICARLDGSSDRRVGSCAVVFSGDSVTREC